MYIEYSKIVDKRYPKYHHHVACCYRRYSGIEIGPGQWSEISVSMDSWRKDIFPNSSFRSSYDYILVYLDSKASVMFLKLRWG